MIQGGFGNHSEVGPVTAAITRGRSSNGYVLPNISDEEQLDHFRTLNGTAPDIVSENDHHIIHTVDNTDYPTSDPVLDIPINETELETALGQLKNGIGAGTDHIIPELLIYAKNILSPYLLTIFQHVFDNGNYPDQWADGILHLIYTKGDVNKAENY